MRGWRGHYEALALRFQQLQGRKRHAAAFFCGVLLTLAMPPVFFWPALFPALIGLYWLIVSAGRERQAFAAGWWFGFGFFTTGLYWISISMLVDAARFAWMIPFAVFGLSGAFALYLGILGVLLFKSGSRGVAGIITFACLWCGFEWLRGHLFTGFPWNLVATAWGFHPAALQGAAIVGVYGLGLLTVLVFAMPAVIVESRRAVPASIAAVIFALAILGWGQWRMAQATGEKTNITVRIVQGAIPQSMKWDPEQQREILHRYLSLTKLPGFDAVTHVVWPETAVPFALDPASPLVPVLAEAAPENGALITGALRSEGEGKNWKIWNSLFVLGPKGVVAAYDKVHLVPFGEYVPYRQWLPIEKITPGLADFSTGPEPVTLSVPGAPPISPLICYEAIFPEGAVNRKARPGWLVNITNDAWFGNSSGPYQHLHLVQLRAIEQGLPMIRAANTGISAVFDAYGRMVKSLPLGQRGIMDAELPAAIKAPPYSRYGNSPLLLLVIVVGLININKRKNNQS